MTSEMLDYEKELEAAAIREMEAKYAAMKLAYDDYEFIEDRDEVVTRGLRDRSPTTRTTSARSYKPNGARDALREGCRKGLLLYPGL